MNKIGGFWNKLDRQFRWWIVIRFGDTSYMSWWFVITSDPMILHSKWGDVYGVTIGNLFIGIVQDKK